MRATYVLRNGKLVPKHLAEPHPSIAPRFGRAPAIRPDGMNAIQSMADGRYYDSKSAYYRHIKNAGCEIIGDDRNAWPDKAGYREQNLEQDIITAKEQLEADYIKPPEPGPVVLGGWE